MSTFLHTPAPRVAVTIVIRADVEAWTVPFIFESAAKITPVDGSLVVTADHKPAGTERNE